MVIDTLQGNAIDYSARRLGLYHQAAFDMRHKILLALQELPEAADTCLGEVSEFDETFVLDCYKGRKLEDTVRRAPRRHGSKAEKGAFPMNMSAYAPVSSAKGMPLLPPSTGQNPVQKNSSAYLKAISRMGHLPCATG